MGKQATYLVNMWLRLPTCFFEEAQQWSTLD